MSAYQIFSNYMANCSTFPSNHCPMSYPSTDAYKCKFKCVHYMLYLLEMLIKANNELIVLWNVSKHISSKQFKKIMNSYFDLFYAFLRKTLFSDFQILDVTNSHKCRKRQRTRILRLVKLQINPTCTF